jgi:TM2 domain-containing membrane protein YozV
MADRIVPDGNPSGVVYGVIVTGALLAAESGRHETYADTVGSAAIAIALYWLAHAYATVLGRRLLGLEQLTAGSLWRALVHDWALVRGAAIPVLVLLVAWVTGAAQATAVTAALWSAVASVIGFELLAGARSRPAPRELALQLGVGVVLGLGILALRVLLH